MKFYELFYNLEFKDVKPFLDDIFEKKYNLKKFEHFFSYLKKEIPENSELVIFIRLIEDPFSKVPYYHISGLTNSSITKYKNDNPQIEKLNYDLIVTYNISCEKREILLGADILNYDTLIGEISVAHIVALCLFEFSFFGITSDDIKNNPAFKN